MLIFGTAIQVGSFFFHLEKNWYSIGLELDIEVVIIIKCIDCGTRYMWLLGNDFLQYVYFLTKVALWRIFVDFFEVIFFYRNEMQRIWIKKIEIYSTCSNLLVNIKIV